MPVFKFNKGMGNMPGYYTKENDTRHYQRIVAGFCPPSGRPGAVVIVAEEMALRPPAHIFWIDELAEHSLDRLFEKAVEFKARYPVEEFFGRVSDQNFLRSLSHWNNVRAEKHLATFQISAAPNSDTGNISFHVNILRQRLSRANKTFWLGDSEFLPPALQELPQGEVHTSTDTGYPILSAAAYAVSALDVYQTDPFADNQPRFGKMDYDVLNFYNKQ